MRLSSKLDAACLMELNRQYPRNVLLWLQRTVQRLVQGTATSRWAARCGGHRGMTSKEPIDHRLVLTHHRNCSWIAE